jgi:hypothetical protein
LRRVTDMQHMGYDALPVWSKRPSTLGQTAQLIFLRCAAPDKTLIT